MILQALAHLFDAHDAAVVAVAVRRRRHLEFELIVAAVRALLAQIPVQSGRAQTRSGDAPLDRFARVVCADADRALLQDAVLHHHLVVVIAGAGPR